MDIFSVVAETHLVLTKSNCICPFRDTIKLFQLTLLYILVGEVNFHCQNPHILWIFMWIHVEWMSKLKTEKRDRLTTTPILVRKEKTNRWTARAQSKRPKLSRRYLTLVHSKELVEWRSPRRENETDFLCKRNNNSNPFSNYLILNSKLIRTPKRVHWIDHFYCVYGPLGWRHGLTTGVVMLHLQCTRAIYFSNNQLSSLKHFSTFWHHTLLFEDL